MDNYKQLITEIDAINQAWHSMQALLTDKSPTPTSLQPIEALSSTEKFLKAARSAAFKNFSEV